MSVLGGERFRVYWIGMNKYVNDDSISGEEIGNVLIDVPELDIKHHRLIEDIGMHHGHRYLWLVESAYKLGMRHGEELNQRKLIERLGLTKGASTEMPYDLKRLVEKRDRGD